MKLLHYPLLCSIIFVSHNFNAQILVANNALIRINGGGIVHCNGGVQLLNSQLDNNGSLTVTKNCSFPNPGNFQLENLTLCQGNGLYSIEQDWINDATFNGNSGTVRLFGNTEQLITSNNGTSTVFNNLQLSGNGTATNRRKTLTNVDLSISPTGVLDLGNRELNGNTQSIFVTNSSSAAITGSLNLNNEGFISNLTGGFTTWFTNSTNNYVFPVGSSDGIHRFRPVSIAPVTATSSNYAVRFNNYLADLDGFSINSKEPEIDELNSAFYHSIENLSGEPTVNLGIGYLPQSDGDFSGMAHWNTPSVLWRNMDGTIPSILGNYSSITKINWTFNDNDIPYILTILGDNFEIPNVFTPNGDGINDTYFVTSKGIKEYSITIVNRWGELVFSSTDVNEKWDGTSGGKLCTDGVYFYTINAKSAVNEYKKQGHITLTAYN